MKNYQKSIKENPSKAPNNETTSDQHKRNRNKKEEAKTANQLDDRLHVQAYLNKEESKVFRSTEIRAKVTVL